VVLPAHPRTREMAPEFGFEFDCIRAIEPGVRGVSATIEGPGAGGLGRWPGGDAHSGGSGVTLRENTEKPEIRWKGECAGWSEFR
jgi:hypothetical protein